jgi:hypothetical protein
MSRARHWSPRVDFSLDTPTPLSPEGAACQATVKLTPLATLKLTPLLYA